MQPVELKAKYAFHLLLAYLRPEVILDIGSMDGADSKRFAKLVPSARIVAFEGNPYNFQAMLSDKMLRQASVRVEHRLVSDAPGATRFFVQRPVAGATGFNRGTSSTLARAHDDERAEEVVLDAVRVDEFLDREYPSATRVAAWVDVEGFAYAVLSSMAGVRDRMQLLHVEVETKEIWAGQKLEAEVLALAENLGLVLIAKGRGDTQRDVILANRNWFETNQIAIRRILGIARLLGPTASRIVQWSQRGASTKAG